MTLCYNFYFAPNITVRGNRRRNYACVSLFYSTAFVIVIRLVYKNLCYWPIRVCITFIQWNARTQELLSRVRDVPVRYFDFGSLPFFKDWIYVRLRLCYCYSALCLTLIQTWGTLVVTGKDDNVSGFSECEILSVCRRLSLFIPYTHRCVVSACYQIRIRAYLHAYPATTVFLSF